MKNVKLLSYLLFLFISCFTLKTSNAIDCSTVLKKSSGAVLGLYAASCFAGLLMSPFLDEAEQAGNGCVNSFGAAKAQKCFTLSKWFLIPGFFPGYIAAELAKIENEMLVMQGVNGLLGLLSAYASYKLLKPIYKRNKSVHEDK